MVEGFVYIAASSTAKGRHPSLLHGDSTCTAQTSSAMLCSMRTTTGCGRERDGNYTTPLLSSGSSGDVRS